MACGSPTEPHAARLTDGHYSGSGACLTVADSGCDFVAGCGHGQFPRPDVRGDGTFDVDGTFRIEVGPVNPNPPPPAHFSGTVSGSTVMLTVTPAGQNPSSYSMTLGPPGKCGVPCV